MTSQPQDPFSEFGLKGRSFKSFIGRLQAGLATGLRAGVRGAFALAEHAQLYLNAITFPGGSCRDPSLPSAASPSFRALDPGSNPLTPRSPLQPSGPAAALAVLAPEQQQQQQQRREQLEEALAKAQADARHFRQVARPTAGQRRHPSHKHWKCRSRAEALEEDVAFYRLRAHMALQQQAGMVAAAAQRQPCTRDPQPSCDGDECKGVERQEALASSSAPTAGVPAVDDQQLLAEQLMAQLERALAEKARRRSRWFMSAKAAADPWPNSTGRAAGAGRRGAGGKPAAARAASMCPAGGAGRGGAGACRTCAARGEDPALFPGLARPPCDPAVCLLPGSRSCSSWAHRPCQQLLRPRTGMATKS